MKVRYEALDFQSVWLSLRSHLHVNNFSLTFDQYCSKCQDFSLLMVSSYCVMDFLSPERFRFHILWVKYDRWSCYIDKVVFKSWHERVTLRAYFLSVHVGWTMFYTFLRVKSLVVVVFVSARPFYMRLDTILQPVFFLVKQHFISTNPLSFILIQTLY
jgi:hypothetical protein